MGPEIYSSLFHPSLRCSFRPVFLFPTPPGSSFRMETHLESLLSLSVWLLPKVLTLKPHPSATNTSIYASPTLTSILLGYCALPRSHSLSSVRGNEVVRGYVVA